MVGLLVASAAYAGGYYYSDAGIVATGRGGAFVAGADDQFAQYYNPAGLIKIDAPTFNVGLSEVQQAVGFKRQKEDGSFYPEVRNQASPFDVPELGFATPLGTRTVVALGFYSPFAPSSLYAPKGPQRYTIKDTGIYQFSIGPSVAVRVHDLLVLGLGLQWQYLDLSESVNITTTDQDDPKGDVGVKAHAVDSFTPNLNAGLLFEPVDPVTVGFAIQPPTHFHAHGSGSLDFSDNALSVLMEPTKYSDDAITINIDLPWVVRAGVAVRPIPALEIEGAVVWQDWSSLADISIEDVDVTVQSKPGSLIPIPPDQAKVADSFSLPAGLKDTVSLRLGVEGSIRERVELRAGGFWENGSLGEDSVSVALVDPAKVQIGTGASVWVVPSRIKLDAAFAWLFFPSLEIRDSTVKQIDAGLIPSPDPLVVGNGDLRSHGWVLGVAGSVAFPKKPRS